MKTKTTRPVFKMPDKPLGLPLRKFSETFSAMTVLKEKFGFKEIEKK